MISRLLLRRRFRPSEPIISSLGVVELCSGDRFHHAAADWVNWTNHSHLELGSQRSPLPDAELSPSPSSSNSQVKHGRRQFTVWLNLQDPTSYLLNP